jgi:glycine/D-amino acid oxidase-like deaminating enzyme
VRLSPDNRLVTGGLVVAGPGSLGRAVRSFARRLARFFPGLGQFEAEYVWDGVIASTTTGLPTVTTIAPGLDAAIGCNGRGVALTTALGAELARRLAGAQGGVLPEEDSPKDIAFHRLISLGPSLWLPWSNFRDWIETRR